MWYIVIKMVAKEKGIWNYINSETSQELCPILIKSVVTTKGKRLGTYTRSVPQRRDKATRSG